MVSVVIPIYNTSRYLQKCLDSVISQTYRPLEIICVNDGSTDNSPEILNDYAFRYSEIKIVDKPNGGQSSARNAGMTEVSGEWIMFLDSDDWLESNAVETAVTSALEYSADIIAFDYICEYSNSNEIRSYLPLQKEYSGTEFFLRLLGPVDTQLSEPEKLDALSIVCAKLYSSNIIKYVRFEDLTEIGTSEDTLFNLTVARNISKAVYIPFAGYHYLKTNENATTQKYKPSLIEKWNNLYNKIQLLVQFPQEETAFLNRIACSIIGAGINEMRSPSSFLAKRRWVKRTLGEERFAAAFRNLNLTYVTSLKWKIFFWCAKHSRYTSLTLLLSIMAAILRYKAKK